MNNVINLAARELEEKVDAGVKAAVATGVDPRNMGEADRDQIALAVQDDLSPAAQKQAVTDYIHRIARQVCGGRIAGQMWLAGYGWHDATEKQILVCGWRARIANDDVLNCLTAFRNEHRNFTAEEAADYTVLARFMPLFATEPPEMTLGQAAARKAAAGDKLALSFLAWKEIA